MTLEVLIGNLILAAICFLAGYTTVFERLFEAFNSAFHITEIVEYLRNRGNE